MSDTSDNKKELTLKALEKSLGVVTDACRKVKISRQTFYRWCKEDEEFKKAVDDIQNVAIDFVESSLFELIRDGNASATIFYLKTKAKHRGYIERQEITGKEGKDLMPPPLEILQAKRTTPIKPD